MVSPICISVTANEDRMIREAAKRQNISVSKFLKMNALRPNVMGTNPDHDTSEMAKYLAMILDRLDMITQEDKVEKMQTVTYEVMKLVYKSLVKTTTALDLVLQVVAKDIDTEKLFAMADEAATSVLSKIE